ncbi:MAG: phosphatase PAP2 family protein [Nitratireductor sp.]|nr:phosphatase PAP2 family protein [Nitratireductor sp.]
MNAPATKMQASGADRAETDRILTSAALACIATALVFAIWPQFDLWASSLFFQSPGRFELSASAFWRLLRTLFLRGFALWYVVIVVSLVVSIRNRAEVLGLDWQKWLYLGLCSLAGPLLLTNIILKENWGRWRPYQVRELGGDQLFAWPLDWSGSCADNCSFVSGEVSSATMALFALALISTMPRRKWLYAAAAAFWATSSLMRVGQGGHFLSDTIFAGLFMVLIGALLHRFMFARKDGTRLLPADPGEAGNFAVAAHDRLWKSVCDRGLALIDRIAPRR